MRARYDAELPPFISIVRHPGRPVFLGVDRSSGVLRPEAPEESFQTFSGFRAQRARETPGQRAPKCRARGRGSSQTKSLTSATAPKGSIEPPKTLLSNP